MLLVIKHEIVTTLSKRSFWLTTFVFPIIIFGISFGSQFLAQNMIEEEEGGGFLPGQPGQEETVQPLPLGYVDQAGLINDLPPNFPEDRVLAFPDEEAAHAALEAEEISEYFLIPVDFRQTSEVTVVQSNFSPLDQLGQGTLLDYLLTYNLTGDAVIASLINDPTPSVNRIDLGPAAEEGVDETSELLATVVPYAVIFIFFFVITMSSGYMLRSVSNEKENRVVEVLLLSLRPRELMLGKVLGLGVVALLQMAIWMGAGLLVLGERSAIFGIAAAAASFSLPSGFLAWGIIYFLLGYLVFASALGAIGALAPNTREGSQFTFAVLLPLMIPLWFNTAFTQSPNGAMVAILSIFPLTSPVSMMARLAATTVPLWQILLSLGLLAGTTYLFVVLAARFFRADTLLSTSSLDWKRLGKEIRSRISAT
ncbi:MAG: ABC transporter permease [Anaerolineae bacterium]